MSFNRKRRLLGLASVVVAVVMLALGGCAEDSSATTQSSTRPSLSKRLFGRDPDPGYVYSERYFNDLFTTATTPTSQECLAFLYEAQQPSPDYEALVTASFKVQGHIYARDEFARHDAAENNRPQLDLKLAKARSKPVVAFVMDVPNAMATYDFKRSGFCSEPPLRPVAAHPPYGYKVVNPAEAGVFKMPKDKASVLDFKKRAYSKGVTSYTFYAVPESVVPGTAVAPKMVGLKVIAIAMSYGQWQLGLYRLDTGEFKESYDTEEEFGAAKKSDASSQASGK